MFIDLGKFGAILLNKLNLYLAAFLFAISIVFYIDPSLDVKLMSFFYDENVGFAHSKHWLVILVFKTVPVLTILYSLWLICSSARLLWSGNRNLKKAFLNLTILMSLILGPGVVVNLMLKDNFGRARPKQIVEFGAIKTFTNVYEKANQCKSNCSFSSGHAAAAYSFTTIAFLVPAQYQFVTYIAGFAFGTIVGIGRMIQGGHFGSDVVVSAWIIFLINYILLRLYYRKFRN